MNGEWQCPHCTFQIRGEVVASEYDTIVGHLQVHEQAGRRALALMPDLYIAFGMWDEMSFKRRLDVLSQIRAVIDMLPQASDSTKAGCE